MKKTCYLNQHFIPCSEANISLFDQGLLRGYGVFDFLRTYNGHPFLLGDHLSHFRESTRIIGLDLTFSDDHIRRVVHQLIKKNDWRDGGIRLVLTGGPEGNFFILPEELPVFSESDYQKGVTVKTYNYQRPFPKVKSLNYFLPWTLRQKDIFKEMAEIIYTNKDKVLEGAQSNLFIFKEDTLITPKENVFPGATRNLILKLAGDYFKTEERKVFKKEITEAAEIFLTSTTKEVLPVTNWNNEKVGLGKIGERTRQIRTLFKEYVTKKTT